MDKEQDLRQEQTQPPGKVEKILIVETDEQLAKRLYPFFRKERFLTMTVKRLSEAIRNIQQEHVSVLILDVAVNDMAWDDAVPIIKGLDPSLPIIITAAQNTPELEANVLRQKVFYYHVKSFGTEELTLAIRNAMKNHEGP
jgi:DNA-binding NtrC family response regulator